MERFLRLVLVLCLLALAVLTPVWWLQEHPRPAPTPLATPEPTPAPTPEPTPTPDPAALNAMRYREAENAAGAGLLAEALAHWEALGDYEDSAARAEDSREQLYAAAWDFLLRRELGNAAAYLRPLGDYRDSQRWLRYCERHLDESESVPPLIAKNRIYYRPRHGLGTLYTCSAGLFYIPDETGPETQTLFYYPGGSEMKVNMLDMNAVVDYVAAFAPEAVCFFAFENGFHFMDEHNRESWAVMEELLRERSLVPHEIVLVGTSNGFYSAEHLALQLWDEEGLPVRALLSLDAGEDWEETDKLLDSDQLERLAEAGTRLALFEQRKFKTAREPIRQLLRAGLAVELIECDNGDHETITRYAFELGALSWALGECELNPRQYTLTELHPEA